MLSKLFKATVFLSGKNWDRSLLVGLSQAKSHVFPHHYVFVEFIHHDLIHKDFFYYFIWSLCMADYRYIHFVNKEKSKSLKMCKVPVSSAAKWDDNAYFRLLLGTRYVHYF